MLYMHIMFAQSRKCSKLQKNRHAAVSKAKLKRKNGHKTKMMIIIRRQKFVIYFC